MVIFQTHIFLWGVDIIFACLVIRIFAKKNNNNNVIAASSVIHDWWIIFCIQGICFQNSESKTHFPQNSRQAGLCQQTNNGVVKAERSRLTTMKQIWGEKMKIASA